MNKITNTSSTQYYLIQGINTIYNLLKMTHGPKGKNILLDEEKSEIPQISKQSSFLMKQILLKENIKNITILLIQESLSKINQIAGDGTTTSFLITYFIILRGFKNIFRNVYSLEIKLGIKKTIDYLIVLLTEYAQPIANEKMLEQVCNSALSNDKKYSELIAEALKKIGKQGSLTIEENTLPVSSLEIQRGMKFKRGFFSPYFVTDTNKMIVEFDNPYILITNDKICFEKTNLLSLLENLIYLKRPFLIISPEIEEETLSTLILNKINGIIDIAYIKVPKSSNYETVFLQDIALYTNAHFFQKELGKNLQNVQLKQLGQAKKVVITKTNTTILKNENEDIETIQKFCEELKKQILLKDSDYEKDKLEDRIKNLYGINATLKLGVLTDFELSELKKRVQNGISITKSSLYGGILVGGSFSFLHVSEELENWSKLNLKDLEFVGSSLVLKAILEPLNNLLKNNVVNNSVIPKNKNLVNEIKVSKNPSLGYDISKQKISNLIEEGIIDSLKNIVIGLQTSSSISQMILTIDRFICP
jgi:chaperonin GroEL